MGLLTRILYPQVSIDKAKAASQLIGKTIVITGASFGIGEALTRALFHFDIHLILVARTVEKLQLLERESQSYRARVTVIGCDFCNEQSIDNLVGSLASFKIDYFVSNAGKSIMRSFSESIDRIHDYQITISINYLAPVHLISALASSFSAAKTHIVNVSTYNVLMRTPPYWSAYIASKKAMHSWIESNTPELTCNGISVSNVYFPLVESRMKERNKLYKNTPAMSMDSAVAVLIKAMLNRNYDFKPWWHPAFQFFLFITSPLWYPFWHRRIKRKMQVCT